MELNWKENYGMKKKLLTVLLACALAISTMACISTANSNEEDTQSTESTTDVPKPEGESEEIGTIADYEGASLALGDSEIVNRDGQDVIRIHATYTNSNSEACYAMSNFAMLAFQNNNEIQDASDINGDEEDITTSIKDGTSIDVVFAFVLSDQTDVTIQVCEPTAEQTVLAEKTYGVQ